MIEEQPGCVLQDRFREEETRTRQEVAQSGESEQRNRRAWPGRGKESGVGGGHPLMKGLGEK